LRYRVANVSQWIDEESEVLALRVAEKLKVPTADVKDVVVLKKSLDARKKGHPRWLLSLEVTLDGSASVGLPDVTVAPPPEPAPGPVKPPASMPIVVGTGPAGLFAAWGLLERGVRSVLLERGKPVGPRRVDVTKLMRNGALDPESNYNFGEGGAGAYTDGKLGTRIHHPAVRKVVELFARFGGVSRILVEGKPHVGSDLLPCAVESMRAALEAGGCRVEFGARVTDLRVADGQVKGVRLADGRDVDGSRVILAPGNSARDLFELFAARGWPIEVKPFAVGFRAEHPQALIDEIQYGKAAGHPKLPPADYKLAENPRVGGEPRGVFSFCMCPGGIVVPTPTEPGLQCTNGMSNSHRSSDWANAGLVVSVGPADFGAEGFHGPLAGLEWQRKWERAAFAMGGGGYVAPAQRAVDYLAGRLGKPPGRSSYRPGALGADLNELFPAPLRDALKAALRVFDKKMRGFLSQDAILLGVETRTSSPCRLVRGDDLQSPGIRGLYPVGEGAGYAGGIVSSAVDGLRVADSVCAELEAAAGV
jgi:uncharacterized FAD-dependent dehydrogenase